MKIGLIREGKIPIDKRVAVTPEQAKTIQAKFPDVKVVAQSSNIRCYTDDDYRAEGIEVVEDVSDCQILLGVKEVPIDQLIPEKTYFFFSHTVKKQSYNRKLLQNIVKKRIRLIDYEMLTNEEGKRIIAFGRWAGIVGAYNGILTYGKRYNLFHLKPAHECYDLQELRHEYEKVKLPPIKIIVTGGGRVSKGAMEVLMGMGIKKVTPLQVLEKEYNEAVFVQLNIRDYNATSDGSEFDRKRFYNHPEEFEGDFLKYAHECDLLIAGAFWDPRAPVLFHREDILKSDFKITVIADITCDIEGSIPSTKKASTIEDPIYDYNPSNDKIEAALSDEANITVMAVDNLPCELSRDASVSFGNQLVDNVLPELLGADKKGIIKGATITAEGQLTEKYQYLRDYLEARE